jgi:lipid-A-disaccharide synthase-like uncharacterized protein
MHFLLEALPEIKETRYWGLEWSPVSIIGFLGTGMFALRFAIQWIASERKKESVIPLSFWFVSIAGAFFSLVYFLFRRDPVGTLGNLFNAAVYLRNIQLMKQKAKPSPGAGASDRPPLTPPAPPAPPPHESPLPPK